MTVTVNFTFDYCSSFLKANLNQHEDLSNEIDSEALPVGKLLQFLFYMEVMKCYHYSNVRIRHFQIIVDPDQCSWAKMTQSCKNYVEAALIFT
jgi:hypothetical protein